MRLFCLYLILDYVDYFLFCDLKLGCILPLAYGVVDAENDASRSWFFQQFKNAFGERDTTYVASDRNESIMNSVSIIFPNIPHYACI